MLILILGLLIIAFVIFISRRLKVKAKGNHKRYDKLELSVYAPYFGVIIILILAIGSLFMEVATESVLDNKIAMYQEENAAIEKDIDKIVNQYLKHEKDTLKDLKTEESPITLVTLFPELKSDTLVQQQLEIYVANNEKIRSLKEEKIDIAKLKWLLYFGK